MLEKFPDFGLQTKNYACSGNNDTINFKDNKELFPILDIRNIVSCLPENVIMSFFIDPDRLL